MIANKTLTVKHSIMLAKFSEETNLEYHQFFLRSTISHYFSSSANEQQFFEG